MSVHFSFVSICVRCSFWNKSYQEETIFLLIVTVQNCLPSIPLPSLGLLLLFANNVGIF